MGFSVSGATLIVAAATLVAASTMLPVMYDSAEDMQAAFKQQKETQISAQNTDIRIHNVSCPGGTLSILVNNTGATTLSIEKTGVLVNGTHYDDSDYTATINGETRPVWLSGEQANLTISSPPTNVSRVKVVTEYGVSRFNDTNITCS